MKHMACRELSAALGDEWRHIASERRSRDQLTEWATVEPDLAGLGSLSDVVDVIAVPIGIPQERSVAVTEAVIRLAEDDPLARRLLLQVMAPILVKEMFRTLAVLRLAKVEVDDTNANRHYQRTLGYVHTLNAPFFYDYLYPDALKLKAVTYYFNCRYDSAKRTVDEFNRRYPDTMKELQGILEQAPEDFQLFELARKILNDESGLDPFVEQVAQKALEDKTLSKYFLYVEELEREQVLLEEMSGEFISSGVGERVSEDLDLAASAAKERTGAEARSRISKQIKEIKDLNKEMIKVEYEIQQKRKEQGALEQVPPKPQTPEIDAEHEIYNYNGEYWQDELGYYRYEVTSLCKE